MKRLVSLLLPAFLLGLALGVHAQRRADYSRMSSMVRRLARLQTMAPSTRSTQGGGGHLCALVRVNGEGRRVLEDEGCRVLASFGDIHVADIPLSRLNLLSLHPRVLRIEASQSCRLCNDTSAVVTRSVDVRQGVRLQQPFTGQGVVLGLVDVGIDLTNPNFFSSDLRHYRIKRFWDQLAFSPEESLGGEPQFVGTLFTDSATILAHARSVDSSILFHGTHTLGTAGGNGFSTPYMGMAPGSDLCVVSNAVGKDVPLIADTLLSRFTTATDILAFKYIFDYAESQGKPCVVSFSEGSPQTLEADNLLYDEVLAQLTGPGRILVAAAGNEGHIPTYLYKEEGKRRMTTFFRSSGSNTVNLSVRTTGQPILRTVIWRSAAERDTLEISASALCQLPDSLWSDTLKMGNKSYLIDVSALPNAYDNGQTAYEYRLRTPGLGDDSPKIQFELADCPAEAQVYAHSGSFAADALNSEAVAGEAGHNVYFPSCSSSVICVGATAWREWLPGLDGSWRKSNAWGRGGERGRYSSFGPTMNGLTKPDIMAPGTNILSSSNSYYDAVHPDDTTFVVHRQHYNDRTYSWRSELGTSMSTPMVAGIIAQWLEANPHLSPDDIRQVFARTARRLDSDHQVPAPEWGYGEIDAYAGLLDVLRLTGIKDVERQAPAKVHISGVGEGQVRIRIDRPLEAGNCTVRFYRPGGQLVAEQFLDLTHATEHTVSLGVSGIVLVQVASSHKEYCGSSIIKL